MQTRIKICGITRIEDGVSAVSAGVDALGFVFYAGSPRYIDPARARHIVRAVGPFVTTVALFVNATAAVVEAVMAETAIQVLQFHGDEDPTYCDQFRRPYIKAIRMAPGLDPRAQMGLFPNAIGYLFDTWRADQYGGTGDVLDWHRLAEVSGSALILAGGLTPHNVAAGIKRVRPWAVDVSSGVESAPGVKDPGLIKRFVAAVRRVDGGRGAG